MDYNSICRNISFYIVYMHNIQCLYAYKPPLPQMTERISSDFPKKFSICLRPSMDNLGLNKVIMNNLTSN